MTSPATTYELRLAGHLDDHWAHRLGDLTLTRHGDGTTALTGPIVDQAQLHRLLAAIRDLGATLLSLHAQDAAEAAPAPAGATTTSSQALRTGATP